MKALVYKGNHIAELEDVPEPKVKKGQVLVSLAYSSICASDLHIIKGDILLKTKPPVILGHEGVGFVDSKPVVWETTFKRCGKCTECKEGYPNRAACKELIGYVHNGTFAPLMAIPEKNIMYLPEPVSLKAAAVLEPLACACHAFYELLPLPPDFSIAVIGPGTIGNLVAQVAKAHGNKIILIGKQGTEHRLEIARSLGILAMLNTDIDSDWGKETFDAVFECSGSPSGVDLALKLAKRGGEVILVGLGSPSQIDWSQVAYKELYVCGSLGSKRSSWDTALDLLATGKVQTKPLVTDIHELSDWQSAFSLFEKGLGLKHVFKFY